MKMFIKFSNKLLMVSVCNYIYYIVGKERSVRVNNVMMLSNDLTLMEGMFSVIFQ